MKKLLLLAVLLFLQSCREQSIEQNQKIYNHYSFYVTIASSNKIVIKNKKNNQKESASNDTCFDTKTILKAEKSKQLNDFKTLFEDAEYTGYCCCPNTNYCLTFYKDATKIDTFYADTIEHKTKVRLFEKSYQYSYLIEKEKWKSFLNALTSQK